MRRRRSEAGAVTAELALGLPLLLVVTWSMVWLLTVVVDQIRVVDAAREAARALARGDPQSEAVGVARRVAPAGARVRVSVSGERVVVHVSSRATAPAGGLAGGWGVTVDAEAVALTEEGEGADGSGDAAR